MLVGVNIRDTPHSVGRSDNLGKGLIQFRRGIHITLDAVTVQIAIKL